MKLVVKKKDVLYGVNGSDVLITDIANIETLKEGSFLIAFDNGTIIAPTGVFAGAAGEKSIIYHKLNGELVTSSPIYTGKGALLNPMVDHAAAARVVTFDNTIPASISVDMHTGLSFIDYSKNEMDPTRRKDITVFTDENSVQTDVNALAAKVAALPFVATCTGTTTLTITYMAGYNIGVSGLGEYEQRVATETTALSYGDALTYEQMKDFVMSVSSFDGNRDTDIDGILGTWAKEYGTEDYPYLVYGIETNKDTYGDGKTDLHRYGAVLYFGIPEGDLPIALGDWLNIFNAAITGISA